MRIEAIPAIDIINGQAVRLTQGDYKTTQYYKSDIAAFAGELESYGAKRLHLVDLDGAKAGKPVHLDCLAEIASTTHLTIDFGGGIKTAEDLERIFDLGASMVTIGSMAVTSPDQVNQWITRYGADRFILGADVRDGHIAIHGWTTLSDFSLDRFISDYRSRGVRQFLCTDISRDGMMSGPANELYADIMLKYPDLYLIASGGIRNMDDLEALERINVPAAVFGKALYEGSINLPSLWKNR